MRDREREHPLSLHWHVFDCEDRFEVLNPRPILMGQVPGIFDIVPFSVYCVYRVGLVVWQKLYIQDLSNNHIGPE